jgi:hypothetical protein
VVKKSKKRRNKNDKTLIVAWLLSKGRDRWGVPIGLKPWMEYNERISKNV